MSLSKCVQRIEESITLAITAKASAMKAEGHDVVGLSAGEPDFDTPENIKQAAIKAINAGMTKYTPSSGTPALRKAIVEKFKKDNGLEYKPAEVMVNCGAKHSVFLAVMALVDPGDEVLIPTPYWVSYPEMVKCAGGTPVVIETSAAEELKLTPAKLAKAITAKTKALILNSPSNPSGMVYTRAELQALVPVLKAHPQVWVISDEIYEKLLYDGAEHVSIASLDPDIFKRTITINGVSKSYSMTGWRIGYAAGPLAIIKGMGNLQSQETSNPTSISQAATLEALTGPQDSVAKMVVAFDERRKYMVGRLNAIPGVKCSTPKGAFYVFPDFSSYYGKKFNGKVISGSVELCNFLLEEMKVAAVPGGGFGADAHLRFSYACSMETIKKALDRIEEGLKKLS